MSAVISLSEHGHRASARAPICDAAKLGRVRVSGGVRVAVSEHGGRTRIDDVSESDGYKVRFPRRGQRPEAILINTGGGLAAGDRVRQDFDVRAGAGLTVTTQASERVYRSFEGATTDVTVHANVGPDALLAWLPQDTILFDKARLRRSISVDLASRARTVLAETVVLGRTLMGEQLQTGLFTDNWRIMRDGRLAFAENVRLDQSALGRLADPALTGGAPVITTMVYAAPDAADRLAPVRGILAESPVECAASAWNGLLVVRGMASKTEPVLHLLSALVPVLGAGPVPRVWWT